jgi:glycosyltransferase involved in cell wall biosynthesis
MKNMEKAKRIGIDARFYGKAGPGRYTKNIIKHLEKVDNVNSYFILLKKDNFEDYVPANPNFKKVLADYPWYSWAEQTSFLFKILSLNLDLYYVPHFNIPVLYPKKIVTAIPDMIMHTFSTEKGTTLWKPYFKFKKLVYKLVFKWSVIRSFRVIVPSNEVFRDFKSVYPNIPDKKFVIATEGIDPELMNIKMDNSKEILEKYGVKKPFLLYLSSMYEHKNVPRLLEAFKMLLEKYKFDGSLVLVGKRDKFSERIQKLAEEMGLGDRVLMPGMDTFVSDAETVALRKEAEAYVFPALKEGFSLTPLEAQFYGLACVISDIACHKEVYEDSVLYFDPYNVEDIAQKINEILTNENLKKEIVKKGFERTKIYNWTHTAEKTLEVFNQALEIEK